jgi:DNA helicase-2/ATP-dependent DNA helicase PcrA
LSGLIKEHSGERRSVALIGRSKKTSTDLYVTLSRHWPMRLIDSRGVEFYHGISAIPSYLAKGLEFDTVIVVATPEDMFSGEGERKLFYTACSRALHRLYVLYPEGKNIEYLED